MSGYGPEWGEGRTFGLGGLDVPDEWLKPIPKNAGGRIDGWISVKDRLPEEDLEAVLVWAQCGGPHVAYRDCGGWCHTECCYDDGSHYMGESIEFGYWMPLPEPPRETK